MKKTTAATMAALTAQIIFGFSFMFTKIALNTATPMTVIANRYMAALVGMAVSLIITKSNIKFTKNFWKLVVMSLFQPVLYFVFESYGIELTTSAFSSVMISLIPVVSMFSGIFVLGEAPSPLQYIFTVLSVAGVAIMAYSGTIQGTVTPLGVVLLFGAVISSVGYNLASRKLSKEFSVTERTFAMTIIGAVVFILISLVENKGNIVAVISSFANTHYTAAILYLGIVSSVIAFYMMNYANTYLPVAKTTVFSNITTVVSVAAGAVFLNEKLTVVSALGCVMIIVGVWVVQLLNVRSPISKQSAE